MKKEKQKLPGAVAWNRCSRDGCLGSNAESIQSWSPASEKRRDRTRDLRGPKRDDPVGGPARGMDCSCCGLCGSRGFQSERNDAWRGTPLLITCWKRWISLKIHRNAQQTRTRGANKSHHSGALHRVTCITQNRLWGGFGATLPMACNLDPVGERLRNDFHLSHVDFRGSRTAPNMLSRPLKNSNRIANG
ncbi:hypothetical protein CC79DRAFT_580311 [Sarocladium strictum]